MKKCESIKEFINSQPKMYKWTPALCYVIYHDKAKNIGIESNEFYLTKTWKELLPLQKIGLIKIIKNRLNNEYYIFIRKHHFISVFDFHFLSEKQIKEMTK